MHGTAANAMLPFALRRYESSALRQVVLQSGTNESNWLAPAGGQFGFTFTGQESANSPDPSNPYRVAVPEVSSLTTIPSHDRLRRCGG